MMSRVKINTKNVVFSRVSKVAVKKNLATKINVDDTIQREITTRDWIIISGLLTKHKYS